MKLYVYQRSRSFIDLGPTLSGSIFLNFFSSVITRQTEAAFDGEPHWDGGTKVCSNSPGHITNMAAMPIYSKTFKNLLLWNLKASDLESWYAASGIRVLPGMFKRCPWVDRNLFYGKSNLVPCAFVWENVTTMAFPETIVVYDITVVDAVN